MNPAVVLAVFVFVYGLAMFLIGTRIGPVIRIQRVSRAGQDRALGVSGSARTARRDDASVSADVAGCAHTRETR